MVTPNTAGGSLPLAYSPKSACALIDCGMTFLYQEIGAGRIEARKAGNKTLIPADSLRTYLKELPKADIRTGRGAAP
jgi:excisionase family DNA binding protein